MSLQHKRGLIGNINGNHILDAGQIGLEYESELSIPRVKIGDGSTKWSDLGYAVPDPRMYTSNSLNFSSTSYEDSPTSIVPYTLSITGVNNEPAGYAVPTVNYHFNSISGDQTIASDIYITGSYPTEYSETTIYPQTSKSRLGISTKPWGGVIVGQDPDTFGNVSYRFGHYDRSDTTLLSARLKFSSITSPQEVGLISFQSGGSDTTQLWLGGKSELNYVAPSYITINATKSVFIGSPISGFTFDPISNTFKCEASSSSLGTSSKPWNETYTRKVYTSNIESSGSTAGELIIKNSIVDDGSFPADGTPIYRDVAITASQGQKSSYDGKVYTFSDKLIWRVENTNVTYLIPPSHTGQSNYLGTAQAPWYVNASSISGCGDGDTFQISSMGKIIDFSNNLSAHIRLTTNTEFTPDQFTKTASLGTASTPWNALYVNSAKTQVAVSEDKVEFRNVVIVPAGTDPATVNCPVGTIIMVKEA